MYLKIKENKVKFNNLLAGESVLIVVDSVILVNETTAQINTSHFIFDLYAQDIPVKVGGQILGLQKSFEIPITSELFFTEAAKKVKEKIITDLGLVDEDIEVLASLKWLTDQAVRPIRLSIPADAILKKQEYRDLVGQMLDLNVPIEHKDDCYSLYLEEIYPEHRTLFDADSRVLIEE